MPLATLGNISEDIAETQRGDMHFFGLRNGNNRQNLTVNVPQGGILARWDIHTMLYIELVCTVTVQMELISIAVSKPLSRSGYGFPTEWQSPV